MTVSEIRQRLRAFICGELIGDPAFVIADDEPLITGGLIDSFALAHVGVFIETAFGVYVADTELTVENMDTLEQIAARVLRG